ncbi:hypothetical protein IV203_017699 [Nitzschia inconspicua]|nr:hypothetical protein IV203_017699 [Nitzschia inconspicua]
MDGDPETAPKNNQKAGLTLGVGAFQYATRRISSDVLPGQKDNSNEEHKNLSRVGRSSQTTKSMKNSKPINVTAQKLESADASKNVSIAEVGEQSFEPLTKGDDKVGMTWPQKENVSKSESLSKPCQPNSCIPTKCILGSFGNRYGMKGRNGEEKRHSNGAENSRIEDKEGTHMYEYELSDQEVFEREEAQSESSSMVVCTEDDDQDHDATYVTKNDDSNIKDTAKPKKKLKSTFQFWKFQSKAAATRKTLKKNNMSNYKLGLASPNPAETKYDNEEDNLRGGGSQREGPASDKDSVSQREAADASSVESRESTMLKEEGNPNLFRKLKSMQFTDQSEVEKLLDERLDTVEAEPDKNANAVERKTKLPTGILKKNSRFSTGWRKDQKATEKNHFEKGDDESNASTVLFTLSAEGEPGFEVMPVLGLIET